MLVGRLERWRGRRWRDDFAGEGARPELSGSWDVYSTVFVLRGCTQGLRSQLVSAFGFVDEEIRPALEEAGWFDGYESNTEAWVAALRSEGFSVNDVGTEVLAHLGGLTVRPRQVGPTAFGSGDAVFEPLWAASGESERILQREAQVGTSLCPVAEWCSEYILLAGGDGAIYAETTFQILRVGENLQDALRTIILADQPPIELP